MGYYIYDSTKPLGQESLGTFGRSVWRDLRSDLGAIQRAEKLFPGAFSLYAFSNFYDDKTFRLIHRRSAP